MTALSVFIIAHFFYLSSVVPKLGTTRNRHLSSWTGRCLFHFCLAAFTALAMLSHPNWQQGGGVNVKCLSKVPRRLYHSSPGICKREFEFSSLFRCAQLGHMVDKSSTRHCQSHMVNWNCILGLSKLGRSKLGRNGTGEEVSAPSARSRRP